MTGDSERDRNMMAHGLMTIEWMRDGSIYVRGQLLKPIDNESFGLARVKWSLSKLQGKARQATKCSQGWIKVGHLNNFPLPDPAHPSRYRTALDCCLCKFRLCSTCSHTQDRKRSKHH
jgi:hypothetical protein